MRFKNMVTANSFFVAMEGFKFFCRDLHLGITTVISSIILSFSLAPERSISLNQAGSPAQLRGSLLSLARKPG